MEKLCGYQNNLVLLIYVYYYPDDWHITTFIGALLIEHRSCVNIFGDAHNLRFS